MSTGTTASDSNHSFYPKDSDESLTVLVTHHVRHDKHEAFKKWSQDTNALVRKFDGFINAEIIRPSAVPTASPVSTGDVENAIPSSSNNVPAGHDEFIAIVRFDNFAHLNGWMKSPERQMMIDRISEFEDEAPSYSFHSLEHWFVTSDDVAAQKGPAGGGPPMRPPAKWKMILVTVAIIYTQTLWIPKVTRKIFKTPIQEGNMHPYLFQFINIVIVVCLSTYILFPVVTRLLSFFLMPGVDYHAKLMELVPSFLKQPPNKQAAAEKAKV
jgi:uncharacterized protein